MLAHPDYNNISNDNYKQKIQQTIMLYFYVFITSSLSLLYVEVIYNTQCQISTRKKFTKRETPRNISNKYVSIFGKSLQLLVPDVYTDDMSDMICQILQYYIQQQHDANFRHLCQHSWVSTSADKYSSVQEKQPLFYVR